MASDSSNARKSNTVITVKTNTKIVSGVTVEDVTQPVSYAQSVSMHGRSVLLTGQTLNRIGDI